MNRNPDKEHLRINAVKRFIELKGSEKQDLDDLVAVASEICGKPIALITLLDEKSQLFKAQKGLDGMDITSTPREIALCNYTLAENKVLVVEDATLDERFADNPLVKSFPHVRFYAGVPLTTDDGYNIGSLCVIDREPGILSPSARQCLQTLARQVMNRMELSNTMESLQSAATKLEVQKSELENRAVIHKAFLNSFSEYFILLDKDLKVVAFNRAWKEFAPKVFQRIPCKGDKMADFEELERGFITLAQQALAGKETVIERMAYYCHTKQFRYRAMFAPFKNLQGEIMGISIKITDIETEKKQGEAIDSQNKAFSEIIKLQSHDVRMPLTNILSIVNLINMENYPPKPQYLDCLQQAANQLDTVIKEIVYKADDGRNALSLSE